MEGIPTIYLPPDDKGSWPARLNYAFGIGVFTNGNEVEAQRRGQMLAQLADDWMDAELKLGQMPSESEMSLLRSLMRDETEVELISFADYVRAAEAAEGTREHAALGYYKNIVGYSASFYDPLVAHRINPYQSLFMAEVFALQLFSTIKFFTELEGTPFDRALGRDGFGHLVVVSLREQATQIARSGSCSQKLDDWLKVLKTGWVYLGYNHGTLPRFLYQ